MSTLWNKGTAATEVVDAFTVGNDRILDMRLAKYDVIGSMAHIKMLESIGLLTAEELTTLTAALEQILKEIEAGEFILEDDDGKRYTFVRIGDTPSSNSLSDN